MQDVLRFWVERGADGYRIDAIDRLMKDPQLRDDPPASEPYGLPLREDEAKLALSNSRNGPGTGEALAKMREAVGDAFLVGEVYLPSVRWQPYSDHFDAVFAFELLLASWDARVLQRRHRGVRRGRQGGLGDVEPRLRPPRHALRSRERQRAAAMMLLTLPGPAFLYQGDEIGQGDGPPGESSATTAPAATASATRCSGTARRAAGSRPGSRGSPRSTRPSATSRPSATTRRRR